MPVEYNTHEDFMLFRLIFLLFLSNVTTANLTQALTKNAKKNCYSKNEILLLPVLMVKNEETVIGKTLQPFVDAGVKNFFIFDTGSTDKTIDATQSFCAKNNCKLILKQEPFINFAVSRNRALELAKKAFPQAIFMVMPDAEWYIHNAEGLLDFCKQHRNEAFDYHSIHIKTDLDYTNQRLFRASGSAKFCGAVHEWVEGKEGDCVPKTIYFSWQACQLGINKSRERWKRDQLILEDEYKKNNTDPRTVFYLAQTHDCLGQKEDAKKFYAERTQLQGYDEERFIAYCRLANVYKSEDNWPQALHYYLQAYAARPHRIEPLVQIAQHYNNTDEQALRYLFAHHATTLPYPHNDRLFIHKDSYLYDRYNLLGISAWYVNRFHEGQKAVRKALQERPHETHLHGNMNLYANKYKTDNFEKEIDHITIAILAKDKAHTLPLYLACLEKQTWPKDKTYLYIRTNNNNDNTAEILTTWLEKNQELYADVYFDTSAVENKIERFGQHEWNPERFSVLAKIRQDSIDWAYEHDSHYCVIDCDNFIKPHTIDAMEQTHLAIVAPLLRMSGAPGTAAEKFSHANSNYSNFHAAITETGYYKESPLYYSLLNQEIKGLIEVPVVHCTYFIRYNYLPKIKYADGSNRYEYVIFSDIARKNNIPQYLDTREVYGHLTFAETTEQLTLEPWFKELCKATELS